MSMTTGPSGLGALIFIFSVFFRLPLRSPTVIESRLGSAISPAGATAEVSSAGAPPGAAMAGEARATAPTPVMPMTVAVAARRRKGFMVLMSSSLLGWPVPGGPADGNDDPAASAGRPRGNRTKSARSADPDRAGARVRGEFLAVPGPRPAALPGSGAPPAERP